VRLSTGTAGVGAAEAVGAGVTDEDAPRESVAVMEAVPVRVPVVVVVGETGDGVGLGVGATPQTVTSEVGKRPDPWNVNWLMLYGFCTMAKVKVTAPLTTKKVVEGVTTMDSAIGVDAVALTCAGVKFICGPQAVGPTR
jgi:hypothetical protein